MEIETAFEWLQSNAPDFVLIYLDSIENGEPKWKDAPEWANYRAMDKDGSWWFYEKEPTSSYKVWCSPLGKIENIPLYNNWKSTLEKKPNE